MVLTSFFWPNLIIIESLQMKKIIFLNFTMVDLLEIKTSLHTPVYPKFHVQKYIIENIDFDVLICKK